MLYWLVGLGGFIGALLRYALNELVLAMSSDAGAVSVYLCNILGSFMLAWIIVRASVMGRWAEHVKLTLGTGLLGSFTTFSALSAETFDRIEHGQWILVLLYISLSIIGGWSAAWLGWRAGQPSSDSVNKGEA